jgi:hypothetical protein
LLRTSLISRLICITTALMLRRTCMSREHQPTTVRGLSDQSAKDQKDWAALPLGPIATARGLLVKVK